MPFGLGFRGGFRPPPPTFTPCTEPAPHQPGPPQPEEPDLAREALEKRLAYTAEVQEREARLQAAREEAAKKREEALAEVLKRREGNAERHGELRGRSLGSGGGGLTAFSAWE